MLKAEALLHKISACNKPVEDVQIIFSITVKEKGMGMILLLVILKSFTHHFLQNTKEHIFMEIKQYLTFTYGHVFLTYAEMI